MPLIKGVMTDRSLFIVFHTTNYIITQRMWITLGSLQQHSRKHAINFPSEKIALALGLAWSDIHQTTLPARPARRFAQMLLELSGGGWGLQDIPCGHPSYSFLGGIKKTP